MCSMISAQCDRLRKVADKLESCDQGYGKICVVLRQAADTILELRDDLQRANDAGQEAEHDESMAWDRVRKVEAENARLRSCLSDDAENARQIMGENTKLRELIQKVWKWESNGCYECPLEKDCKVLCVYDGDCGMAVEIEKELQELGIEADE